MSRELVPSEEVEGIAPLWNRKIISQRYDVAFNLGLVLYYDSFKEIHTISSDTQDLLIEDKELKNLRSDQLLDKIKGQILCPKELEDVTKIGSPG